MIKRVAAGILLLLAVSFAFFAWDCALNAPVLHLCECVGCSQEQMCGVIGKFVDRRGVMVDICDCVSLPEKAPEIALTISPKHALSPAAFRLRAEFKGTAPLPLKWRCPEVVWIWPDGTKSRQVSDCEPQDPNPPRSWEKPTPSRVELLSDQAMDVEFTVEFWNNDTFLASKTVTALVIP